MKVKLLKLAVFLSLPERGLAILHVWNIIIQFLLMYLMLGELFVNNIVVQLMCLVMSYFGTEISIKIFKLKKQIIEIHCGFLMLLEKEVRKHEKPDSDGNTRI